MKGLNDLTEKLFDSIDESRHALDELTLPEGYVTTNKRQKGWVTAKTVKLKQ